MSAKIAESVEVEKQLGWTLTVYRVTLDNTFDGLTEYWTWALTSAAAGTYGANYPPTPEGRVSSELAGKKKLNEKIENT